MAVTLSKGQNVSLSKTDPALKHILIGLGWDARSSDGQPFDLDASLFMTGDNKKVPSDAYFIFYNQLKSPEGAVEHTGDNLTGEGEGDDETIQVALNKLGANIKTLIFTVSSYRGQTFSKVSNAFCRLLNAANNQEVARYNLSAAGNHTGQIMAKLYRHEGEWKMQALGEPCQGTSPDKLLPFVEKHL